MTIDNHTLKTLPLLLLLLCLYDFLLNFIFKSFLCLYSFMSLLPGGFFIKELQWK